MRLIPITAEDEDLTVRLECDPVMMLHIGGPRPEADVRAAHKRRLDLMEKGAARMYKVVADDSDDVLGTIGIWKINWKGQQAYEMGWFVLPEHQGRGVATEAARLILSQAQSDPDVRYVHAFPAVTNAASNAIARKIGMRNQGEFDNERPSGFLQIAVDRFLFSFSAHSPNCSIVLERLLFQLSNSCPPSPGHAKKSVFDYQTNDYVHPKDADYSTKIGRKSWNATASNLIAKLNWQKWTPTTPASSTAIKTRRNRA